MSGAATSRSSGQPVLEQTLVFRLGNELFGLPLTLVREVFDLGAEPIAVPAGPGWLAGIIHHHGRVVPVVELARLLEVEDQGGSQALIVAFEDEQVAFRVRQIESLEEIRAGGPAIRGRKRAWLRGRLLTLLDPAALLGALIRSEGRT